MKVFLLLNLVLFACSINYAQENTIFKMDPKKKMFSKSLQVRNFFQKELIKPEKKQETIKHLMDHYEVSEAEAEIFFKELFVDSKCHKFLQTINSNTFKEECAIPVDKLTHTEMSKMSGRIFLHIANLDLRTMTLTAKKYDIDFAMVLKDL